MKHLKVVTILQARTSSTRLPNKVLLPILEKPLLFYEIERLKRVTKSTYLVLAIPKGDLALKEFAYTLEIPCFEGSLGNVLDRYYKAAKTHLADVVVRVTGDCPLIDPRLVDQVIEAFLTHECDYASNTIDRSYPRGMDTEVFSFW